MPLTLGSFGDMFASSAPIANIKGKGKSGNSKIMLTAQGSKIDSHRSSRPATGRSR